MKFSTYIVLLFSLLSTASFADEILLARNLTQDAIHARQNNLPIVFFISGEDCPYCERLRDEYLQFSPNDKRFILRELAIDDSHIAISFNGDAISHKRIADHYGVYLTPTIAFVDTKGDILTQPIVGLVGMDYYHYYFEKALRESIKALNM